MYEHAGIGSACMQIQVGKIISIQHTEHACLPERLRTLGIFETKEREETEKERKEKSLAEKTGEETLGHG